MASPELEKLIAAKRQNPYRTDSTVAELRAETETRIEANPLPEGTTHESVDANGVPCEWINAPSTKANGATSDGVMFFIHGGGYYRGTVASSRSPAAEMSAACGMRCLSVEYRLSPEHPFPAAIDDTLAAYRWLREQGQPANKIAVSGISAGGGLTCALLLALKAAGETYPACAVPISPWTDLTQSGASYESLSAVDPTISKVYLDRWSASYVGDADPKTPLASPLFGDLAGLPPLLIQVGSAETLLDDSVSFAREAGVAAVDVTLEIFADAIHGWHGSPHLPETQRAMRQIADFVDRHLA